jgi:hypothetical protein
MMVLLYTLWESLIDTYGILFYFVAAILAFVLMYSAYRLLCILFNRIKRFLDKLEGKDISIYDETPYCVKDNFLTKPEMTFYIALREAVSPKVTICPKVGLKDIFFISDKEQRNKYWPKISQKHVDFLLCNPETMQPICGIELDDSSHSTQKAKERDATKDKAFQDAKLPLVRIKTKASYTSEDIILAVGTYINGTLPALAETEPPICPKCQIPMVMRTKQKTGEPFWGCPNFPNCKNSVSIPAPTQVTKV